MFSVILALAVLAGAIGRGKEINEMNDTRYRRRRNFKLAKRRMRRNLDEVTDDD